MKPAPHWREMPQSPQALAHFIKAALHMPRRANDNNRNMPATDYEG